MPLLAKALSGTPPLMLRSSLWVVHRHSFVFITYAHDVDPFRVYQLEYFIYLIEICQCNVKLLATKSLASVTAKSHRILVSGWYPSGSPSFSVCIKPCSIRLNATLVQYFSDLDFPPNSLPEYSRISMR